MSRKRFAALLGLAGLLALTGCTAEDAPAADQGVLRIQLDCSPIESLYPVDALDWFREAGFREVKIFEPTDGVSVVSQLQRGQALTGIAKLSTIAAAILVEAQPLVVVGVLPADIDCLMPDITDGDEQIEETENLDTEAPSDTPSHAEDPWVIVTTRDVLIDAPEQLQVQLAAEMAQRNSLLGASVDEPAEPEADNAADFDQTEYVLDELPALAESLGFSLSAERLIAETPLQLAHVMAVGLELPVNSE